MPTSSGPQTAALLHWLQRGGARMPGLSIDAAPGRERGVITRSAVAEGDVVLVVPRSHLLTRELAMASEIGRAMQAARIRPPNDDSYLAAFLLQEKQADRSFWKPYIESLPEAFPTLPLFFDKREMDGLRGSSLAEVVQARRAALVAEYASLRDNVAGFARLSAADFIRARLVVSTRNFVITVDGHETRALVPMADMMNHARPADVRWGYSEEAEGFTMTATGPLPAGSEVHISYGAHSNRRYLLNYGFAVPDNDAHEEVALSLGVPDDAPFPEVKARILGLESPTSLGRFEVPVRRDDEPMHAMLSFLRVAVASADELRALTSLPAFDAANVTPVSRGNEARALLALRAACEDALDVFETTLEEDDALLADPALPPTTRNVVLTRRGEKHVLRGYVEHARAATTPLLRIRKA